MPITTKSTNTPPEQYYTNAPDVYDWSQTKTLIGNAGEEARGRYVRLVEIANGYSADFQTARYGSGGFFSLTAEQFRRQVELGFITETPYEKQIVSLTKDFDFEDCVEKFHEVNELFDSKNIQFDGIGVAFKKSDDTLIVYQLAVCGALDIPNVTDEFTMSFKTIDGGFVYQLVVRGPRAIIGDKFNNIVAKIESVIKGE